MWSFSKRLRSSSLLSEIASRHNLVWIIGLKTEFREILFVSLKEFRELVMINHFNEQICRTTVICNYCCRLMPESPRWLITHNRRQEAKSLIDRASKGSPDAEMSTSLTSPIQIQELKQESKDTKEGLHKNIKGFLVLLSNSELRKRILITNFTWMTASLTYYALGNRMIEIYSCFRLLL